MKKLMILGAGIYQAPLIETAKRMGLYTIVVSYPGKYPGFSLADKIYELDTTDWRQILQAAREEGIDGICTTGTDVAVRTIGHVTKELNLPGIPLKAAEILTDKYLMKQVFKEEGIRSAEFLPVFSLEEAKEALKKLGSPAVLKVTDSSGSRGVIKVHNEDELKNAYQSAKAYTRKPYLLMEEFIDAVEIGIDAFVSENKIVMSLAHDKIIYKGSKTTVPVGHHFPYSGSNPELLNDIQNQLQKLIQGTGLNNCAVNMDAFVKDNCLYTIEAGGRAGATCIPELVSMYGGFDYYEQMIRNALGMPVDFSMKDFSACSARLLYSEKKGTLSKIYSDRIQKLKEEDIYVSLDYDMGAPIEAMENGTDRIGQAYFFHDTEEEYVKKLNLATETYEIVD